MNTLQFIILLAQLLACSWGKLQLTAADRSNILCSYTLINDETEVTKQLTRQQRHCAGQETKTLNYEHG